MPEPTKRERALLQEGKDALARLHYKARTLREKFAKERQERKEQQQMERRAERPTQRIVKLVD